MRTLPGVPALALCTLFLFLTSSAFAQTLMEVDFDQYTTAGTYTEQQLDSDFNNPPWEDGVAEGRISIVTGAEAYGGSGAALAVSYPAGEHGTKETGGQWKAFLPETVEEAYLSYRIKFKNGFDFVRGGKLPGLAAENAPTGSTAADGTNGWTARLMWRTDFEGTSGQPEQLQAEAISYAKYFQSGPNGDGQEDKIYWVDADENRKILDSDTWYQVIQRVKLNTPGVADGILQIWLDGELVHEQTDVVYRTVAGLEIDQMYFSTFFGGGSSWKTSKDETVYFDDFKISKPDPRKHVPQEYPSIHEAIAAANPGDTVFVRRGDFLVQTLIIDKPMTLQGAGLTDFIAPLNSSDPVIDIRSANVTLKRFNIQRGDIGVLVRDNCVDVKLRSVDVTLAGQGVVAQQNCDGLDIRTCNINQCGEEGIQATDSNEILLSNCRCDDNGREGIELLGCNDADIFRCFARDNIYAGFKVIGNNPLLNLNWSSNNSADGYNLTGNGHIVSGNESRFNGGSGVVISDADGLFFIGNTCRLNSNPGLLTGNLINSTIRDSEFRNNDVDGIAMIDSSNNKLIKNLSQSNGAAGIWLFPSTSDNLVTGNDILNNGSGGGILDEGTNNTLTNNNLSGNQ